MNRLSDKFFSREVSESELKFLRYSKVRRCNRDRETGKRLPFSFHRARNYFILMFSIFLTDVAFGIDADSICPEKATWQDVKYISTKFDLPGGLGDGELNAVGGNVVLHYFSDGIHVLTFDGKSKREMIELNGGLTITHGAGTEGPNTFLGVDMVAGIPLNYIKWKFPNPCSLAPEAKVSFDLPKNAVPGLAASKVDGVLKRSGAKVSYVINVHDISGKVGRTENYQGEWIYKANSEPISNDLNVRGWKVFGLNNVLLDPHLTQRFNTIGELRANVSPDVRKK